MTPPVALLLVFIIIATAAGVLDLSFHWREKPMRISTFIIYLLAMAVGGYLLFRVIEAPVLRDPYPNVAQR